MHHTLAVYLDQHGRKRVQRGVELVGDVRMGRWLLFYRGRRLGLLWRHMGAKPGQDLGLSKWTRMLDKIVPTVTAIQTGIVLSKSVGSSSSN